MAINQAERAMRVLRATAWRIPCISIALGEMEVVESTTLPTAGVYLLGKAHGYKARVLVNPEWCASLSDPELAFVLVHELVHVLDLHFMRQGNRDSRRWNIAGDKKINWNIRAMGQAHGNCLMPPAGLLFASDEEASMTVEDIYDRLPVEDGKGSGPKGPGGDPGDSPGEPGEPRFGQGCGPKLATDADAEEWEKGDGERKDAARHWKENQVRANSIGRGTRAGNDFSKLFDLPVCRVKWASLLRRVAQEASLMHRCEDKAYKRRNRRSTPEVVLPGWIGYRSKVGILIDTSGSMSDDTLAHAVAETMAVIKACGADAYLVAADTSVTWEGWLTADASVAMNMAKARDAAGKGRGGTDFAPAYEAIAKVPARFDALVHMTDGQAYWPDPLVPKNCATLVIALMGSIYRDAAPSGARIRVVETEL